MGKIEAEEGCLYGLIKRGVWSWYQKVNRGSLVGPLADLFLCGAMQEFSDSSACSSGVTKINAVANISLGEGLKCVRPAVLVALCLIGVH